MTNTVTSSAVSTNVDTAEAVPTADQWLEALGGAPVRITNALKTSHPREAWDTATTAADPFPLSQSTDESLVELAEELARIFDEGVTVTLADITSALIAVLALRREDQQKRP